MHIQDLQVDLSLHPDDWDGFEVMENTIKSHDREKGSSTREIILKRVSDARYFLLEYTQWLDNHEFENLVVEVFPFTKTITVYE